ncbi:MAG TPA: TIGR02587 family membrane protein [Geminicoccus sp.]|jgi:putative integral membrane protein (TIGR02587 family)|uniref:TIGR02587 family membrane protein n=1 Tax=Geminicoccus sp. TaxID=2024832 RepID=UPI002E37F62E|nr:TIGR02587 family membrane protein [Geminicoccus sp.]HEX2524804.1 TIGR02587 family membrane protein [Geminicoccus sp.]
MTADWTAGMLDDLDLDYARELARATGGAILFAFPLLMTMEMWWLGFYADPARLALFVGLGMLLLIGLSRRVGFSTHSRWFDDICDALSAYGVGVVVASLLLALFNVLQPSMPLDEWIGKIAIQSVPAGMGAILARAQFAAATDGEEKNAPPPSYGGELFLMIAGAVFVAFNVAPTDEIEQIAQLMTPWHGILLALLSMGLLHLLVYALGFAGQEEWPADQGFVRLFVRFSLAGYGLALIVSLYILWTFGRVDDTGSAEIAMMTVVLGFPSALGAATARLIV